MSADAGRQTVDVHRVWGGMMADGRHEIETVLLADDTLIIRVKHHITSRIDPQPYLDVRDGGTWIDLSESGAAGARGR